MLSLKLGKIEKGPIEPGDLARPPHRRVQTQENVPLGRSSSFAYNGTTPRLLEIVTNDLSCPVGYFSIYTPELQLLAVTRDDASNLWTLSASDKCTAPEREMRLRWGLVQQHGTVWCVHNARLGLRLGVRRATPGD